MINHKLPFIAFNLAIYVIVNNKYIAVWNQVLSTCLFASEI